MKVLVEFFGIPRQRAGVAEHIVQLPDGSTIASVYKTLAKDIPQFADACLTEHGLQPGYIASVNGLQFVKENSMMIRSGDVIQILSADVGG